MARIGRIILVFFILGMAIYFTVRVKQMVLIDREISLKKQNLSRLSKDIEGYADEEDVEILKEKREDKEEIYKSLTNWIKVEEKIPKDISEPSLYFISKLDDLRKDLSIKADEAGVTLPPYLGFKADLPQRDEVEPLLSKLEIVAYIVDNALEQGVLQIDNIYTVMDEELQGDGQIFVEVNMAIPIKGLVNLIYRIVGHQPVILIDRIEISTRGEDILFVKMRLKQIVSEKLYLSERGKGVNLTKEMIESLKSPLDGNYRFNKEDFHRMFFPYLGQRTVRKVDNIVDEKRQRFFFRGRLQMQKEERLIIEDIIENKVYFLKDGGDLLGYKLLDKGKKDIVLLSKDNKEIDLEDYRV